MSDPRNVVAVFPLPDGGVGGAFDLLVDLMHAVDRGDALVRLGDVTVPPAVALADLRAMLAAEFPEIDLDEIRDHVRRRRAS